MNRLFLVRHGGSTGNADQTFYQYNDSALRTGDTLAKVGGPTWRKPGNFDLEVFASKYFRTQKTARICLDQMGLLLIKPRVEPLLNERNYGLTYMVIMDQVAD